MVIADTNKGSYFFLSINIPDLKGYSNKIEPLIDTNIDIILGQVGATSQIYKFKSLNKVIYLFSTSQRKRKGQISKLVDRNLLDKGIIDEYECIPFFKHEFNEAIEDFKLKKSVELLDEPKEFDGYTGNDLKIFNNKENWHNWQLEIYNQLFFTSGAIKPAKERQILALYDKDGNSGKSSFFKYLFYNYGNEIGRVTYATASQLRASLIQIGAKKIYIIDLARSKAKNDSQTDLLSAIEDLKNGVITSAMYGSGKTLLMDIPHILVSSNYIFDQSLLSKDRWKILKLENNNLIDITEEIEGGKYQQEIVVAK